MIRRLCEIYGYTPAQIADMTLYQIYMLSSEPEQLDLEFHKRKASPEARAKAERLKAELAKRNIFVE